MRVVSHTLGHIAAYISIELNADRSRHAAHEGEVGHAPAKHSWANQMSSTKLLLCQWPLLQQAQARLPLGEVGDGTAVDAEKMSASTQADYRRMTREG